MNHRLKVVVGSLIGFGIWAILGAVGGYVTYTTLETPLSTQLTNYKRDAANSKERMEVAELARKGAETAKAEADKRRDAAEMGAKQAAEQAGNSKRAEERAIEDRNKAVRHQEEAKTARIEVEKKAAIAESARMKAEKIAGDFRLQLAVQWAGVVDATPEEEALKLVESELKAEPPEATPRNRVCLRLARARLLLEKAERPGKTGNRDEFLKQSIASALNARELAGKDNPPLLFSSLFLEGVAREAAGQLEEALNVFKLAKENAPIAGRKRAETAMLRIEISLESQKRKTGRRTVSPGDLVFVALRMHDEDAAPLESDSDRLLRMDEWINEAKKHNLDDANFASWYLIKAALQLRVGHIEMALDSTSSGFHSLNSAREERHNVEKELRMILQQTLEKRDKNPGVEQQRKLENANAEVMKRLNQSNSQTKSMETKLAKVNADLTKVKTDLQTQTSERDEAKKSLKAARTNLTTAEGQLKTMEQDLKKATVERRPLLRNRAVLTVDLPTDAKLFVNDRLQTDREFFFPSFDPTQPTNYHIRMELGRAGRTLTGSQRVMLRAGREAQVKFAGRDGTVAQPVQHLPLTNRALLVAEVPIGLRLYINETLHSTTGKQTIREIITERLTSDKVYTCTLRIVGTTLDGRELDVKKRVGYQRGNVVCVSFIDD